MTLNDTATPTAVANQALDAAGIDFTLGDIQEGTRPAQICLRAYSECLRQLLRGAPWDFARKEAPLFLLADATGQTDNVGTAVPGGQFIYSYAYPQDCARVRYIPWIPFLDAGAPSGNITPPNPTLPLTSASGQPPYIGQRVVPARYLVTSDYNNLPSDVGQNPNAYPGVSPIGRTVILCNVQNARAVYTYDAIYPSVWDHQFRAAMVAYLASEIAMPLAIDKKFGLTMRDRNIAIAMEKIKQARLSDGNEMWASSDIPVDWMRGRVSGGYGAANQGWGGYGAAPGYGPACGYDSVMFSGGSAY